ncbi:MAG: anaerobic ribonucleoside-triphosphate reductase activating protein [Thermodesulfobacteriota bacterium]|nr:anaerobic ribonucleoside-triphosphate reductase activating protein [Thermodesulfobacteriota bacterium]
MIEIKGFLETSFLDWPGNICSVLFLPHCNFRCPYCHNHPLVFHPEQYASVPLKEILLRLRSFKGWIDGVCVTGGEPTLHINLPLLIQEIKRNGFLVKLDTNGSNPEMLEKLIEKGEVDFISMDVKAPLDPFSYRRSTGLSIDLAPILKSIEILKRGKVEYQFRMTVVPQLHCEEDIKTLGEQLRAGRRLILQNFNPENPLDPSLKKTNPYDPKVLKEMERIVQEMV